jgi:hypothetical protein
MVGMLLAMAALQQAPNLVRFDCRIPDAHGRETYLPLAITLDVHGDHIASVIVAGPQLFSSYQRVPPAERPVRPENLRLLPRDMQWHGNFQGRAIRLRRAGAGMVLEPARDTGAYAGFWNHLVSAVPYAELHGSIDCRILSGTLNESARS